MPSRFLQVADLKMRRRLADSPGTVRRRPRWGQDGNKGSNVSPHQFRRANADMLPALTVLGKQSPRTASEVRDALATEFALTPEDLAQLLPSGKQATFKQPKPTHRGQGKHRNALAQSVAPTGLIVFLSVTTYRGSASRQIANQKSASAGVISTPQCERRTASSAVLRNWRQSAPRPYVRAFENASHSSGLGRPEIDTDSAKRARARRLRGTVEDFGLPGDFEIGETCSDDRRL